MQRWKKHLWTGLLLGASVLLIIAAVAMGVVRLVDLAAPKYREKLATTLSESLDLPVTIGGIGMSWQAFRPSFELDNVVVLDSRRRSVFQVGHVDLPFKWGSLMRGELFPYLVRLNELALVLEWRPDGSIGISGVEADAESGELDLAEILGYLDKIHNIEIVDGVINWNDFGAQIGLTRVEKVNASLNKTDNGLIMTVVGNLPRHLGDSFQFDAEMVGDLDKPSEMDISTFFSTGSLYADGWLAPVLRETVALRGGPVTAQFSSHWQGLTFVNAALRISASPLKNVGSDAVIELPGINAELKITPLGDGWDMDVLSLQYWHEAGKSPVSRGGFRYQPTPDGFGTRLDAELDSIRITDLTAWLSVLEVVGNQKIPVGPQVKGQLLNTRFEYYQAVGSEPQFSLRGLLSGLGMPASGVIPGVKGFNGRIYATHDAGRIELSTEAGELDFPTVFTEPLPLKDFKTILNWEKLPESWRFFTEDLRLKALTLEAGGQMELLLDKEASPSIDLTLDFKASDIMPLKPFIPLPPALPLNVGEWLAESLQAGVVPSGKMQLKGRLASFPYENANDKGIFRIDFNMTDATLAYSPGWPEVKEIAGEATFKGRSMVVNARKGTILDVPIGKTRAAIPDFLNPVLVIRGRVQADVGKQLRFLEASPLKESYQGLLDAISISGPGRLDLSLDLPLSDVEAVRISGDIDLQGATLKYSGLPDPVTQIRGVLHFSENGLAADALNGRFMDLPLLARLTPVTGAATPMTALHATTTITLPDDASRISTYIAPQKLKALAGQTEVSIDSQFDTSASASELVITTDLKGMRVDLGRPFGKTADEIRNVRVAVRPQQNGSEIKWQFAESLQGNMKFQTSGAGTRLVTGRLFLGPNEVLPWPEKPGFYIDGNLPMLDLANFAMPMGDASISLPAIHMNASLGELRVAGQTFRKLTLKSDSPPSGSPARLPDTLNIQSEDARGKLKWQRYASGRLVVTGDFDYLSLTVPDEESEEAGVDEQAPEITEPVDPAQLPVVNLHVQNFRLGGEKLGTFKLDTLPIDTGLRIALLEIGGRNITVRGGGEWVRQQGQSSARLVMNINGKDIAGLLNATGYAPSITAEQADIFMELDCSPDAAGLTMSHLNGKMSFDLVDGSLLEVKPGAGRVLSLLSFYALPRRLSLDFSDVLGKGTAFDKLTGDFAIVNGNATTDNLEVVMPSAHIEVKGRVGLAAQDYDQIVTINPEISSGVALAGALLGGPVLGLGLWIAQEFMDKPFDQVAQIRYRLTGSWDDPQVRPLGTKDRKKTKKKSSIRKAGSKTIAKPVTESPEELPPETGSVEVKSQEAESAP